MNVRDDRLLLARLRQQALREQIRVTAHAHQEMVDEEISLHEVYDVLLKAALVENYPDHQRGACCLVCGKTSKGRYVHVVCTTSRKVAIIITVYEPMLPKWATPFERGQTP